LFVSKSMEDEMNTIESWKPFIELPSTCCGYRNWFTESFVFNLSLSMGLTSRAKRERCSFKQTWETQEKEKNNWWVCIGFWFLHL
jgi:hypothetical protein